MFYTQVATSSNLVGFHRSNSLRVVRKQSENALLFCEGGGEELWPRACTSDVAYRWKDKKLPVCPPIVARTQERDKSNRVYYKKQRGGVLKIWPLELIQPSTPAGADHHLCGVIVVLWNTTAFTACIALAVLLPGLKKSRGFKKELAVDKYFEAKRSML